MVQGEYGIDADDFFNETDIIKSSKLTETEKRELLSQQFARTASNGDVNALESMWRTCEGLEWIDIDYRDDQGSTPLICASCFGHTHIAELLLGYSASVNLQDNSGWTALMWATTNHNEELVRVLLERGASSSVKTARGHTAINIASSNLSSASDSEGSQRSSISPAASDGMLADGASSHFEDLAHVHISSETGSIGNGHGAMGSFEKDSESLLVGSPRSFENSAIGTPSSRRTNGRDSFAAGQSVLSMLQASTACAGDKITDTADESTERAEHGLLSPTRSADGSRVNSEGLGLTFGDGSDCFDVDGVGSGLARGMRALAVNSEKCDGDSDGEARQTFDWDSLQLDQMYVISPATVPQFLHAVVKDIQPTQWLQSSVQAEHRFVPASMIFLAARFAHYLGTPDFLETFLAEAIASIIHEVQSHKSDPISLAFWMSNMHTLIYFLKRDSTLVQITSDAQGRICECMHDAYALLIRAMEAELEPLLDAGLLAHEPMPEMFADVRFEAERSQRLSMFFFGGQADASRKSADGRPLRRSQTLLRAGRPRRSSILAPAQRPTGLAADEPATAVGEVPAWIGALQQIRGSADEPRTSTATGIAKRASSGDTFVSGRSSSDNARSAAALFSMPSPRTIAFMLDKLVDLLGLCELHPSIAWGVIRQVFWYLGSEAFNRVLTTRDFSSRSRAMQIRLNVTQLSDWVRANEALLPVSTDGTQKGDGAATADALLFRAHFDPLVELLELLQCLTHLPDLGEYFETTAKMQHLNVLQQETTAANYRYEVQEPRIAGEITEYLQNIAKEIRDGQRAEREKKSIERASRRSVASTLSDRRTLDGRPTMLSLDLASPGSRASSGVVRVLTDSAQAGAAAPHSEQPPSTVSVNGSIPLTRRSGEGGASQPSGDTRSRTGTRSGRRGLLLPIARPSARPSVRTLFPAAPSAGASGRTSTGSHASESLEPINETSLDLSRQRSRTTIDSSDAHSDDSSAIVLRLSGDAPVSPPPLQPPNTAPVCATWGAEGSGSGDDQAAGSLRARRSKQCRPEHMRELLDASELLPFAVPTSRDWLAWWQSHAPATAQASCDWSNETIACHKAASHGEAALSAPTIRPELAPVVPSEFLSLLSETV
ncbi:hypothetical protein COEREDRAFT_99309 [Coemansia reversa NRRL 1564]|uniref:Dilute domain-containing protein n=1 Tax=Coemansia reversa (strain ATCC 12441 / NRRL 1564) TaxID=763665 RepID=A0A2G5B4G7_COERN|nr:hypothetical protein COEREDRAFT_99309 [Coemansia reversa NRRL 1564]|eukprot:PIA13899.1 hypothetical protein COEREDRAFT_99309 [Coemansia reversa NRRL 1564]